MTARVIIGVSTSSNAGCSDLNTVKKLELEIGLAATVCSHFAAGFVIALLPVDEAIDLWMLLLID